MKKILLIAIAMIIVGVSLFVFFKQSSKINQPELKTVTINNKTIAVEVTDTPAEREKGLSGHPPLLPGTGLLFIFDEPGYYGFWMKEMNFNIDIFWLDANYQIVDSWLNADPSSYPKSVSPKTKAKYVLETNVGEIKP